MANPALQGNEIVYVVPVDPNGTASPFQVPYTTGQIAALASTETSFVATPITTVGNGTLTAAALVGGEVLRSGPTAAYTDTTDTAANIVAALPGGIATGSFFTYIKNATAFTQTLSAGTGVTPPLTVIIPPFSVMKLAVQITSATAVTFLHIDTTPISIGQNVTVPTITTLNTVGAGTITAVSFSNGITARGGSQSGSPFTDTTDTAANIIAACANLVNKIGTSFIYYYENSTNAVATITGGTGVTVSGVTAVPPNTIGAYLITYTAAATITMVGLGVTQSISTQVTIAGSSSGFSTLQAPSTGGGTNTLPTTTGTLALSAPVPVAAGATLAVTAAMSGAPILLNTASGSVATLPAATGSGNKYTFIVTTTTTSAKHAILAASSSDFLNGIAVGENSNTAKVFASAAATNHSIQMPFTGSQPSGGIIGDQFVFTDVAANLWQVNGTYQAGTIPTTPFSSATS